MNMRTIAIIIFIAASFGPAAFVDADTIYFNNGTSREGIIKAESSDSVEIDIGVGTVAFPKKNIVKIERSTAEEKSAITQKWQKAQETLNKEKDGFERERQQRFSEYDKWTKEAPKSNVAESTKGGEIPLIGEPDSKNMAVAAVINGKVNVTLILDTGADVVVLSRKIGEALGVDLSNTNEMTEFHLTGDRRAKARMVILDSITVNGIEAKNVQAGILLDENSGLMLRDGLLGMTYLKHFNFKIDRNTMKLILDRIL